MFSAVYRHGIEHKKIREDKLSVHYRRKMKTMDARQSVQNLAETIHSLLGLKAHLTSAWVKSVCDIVKNLPSEKSSTDIKPKDLETGSSSEIKDVDSGTDNSETKGWHFALVFPNIYVYTFVCSVAVFSFPSV